MRVVIFITTALLAFSSPATAQGLSNGNGLYAYCRDKSAESACALYLSGLIEGMREGTVRGVAVATMAFRNVTYDEGKYGVGAVIKNKEACQTFLAWKIPDGADAEQIPAIVLKWLKDNPAQRHQDSVWIVRTALSQAWPVHDCPMK